MPKSVDPEQKRAEFVAASWDVIASEGLKAATLRRVAAEAGYTTGSLTHYFSDRRSLLVDSLRAAHYQAGARMVDAAEHAASASERLAAVLHEALPLDAERLREWRVWLAFWAEAMNNPELAAENDRRYAEWREMLRDLVAPLFESAAQTDHQVAHLIALVDGLGLRIARLSRDMEGVPALASRQRECRETLSRHLAAIDAG